MNDTFQLPGSADESMNRLETVNHYEPSKRLEGVETLQPTVSWFQPGHWNGKVDPSAD